MLTQPKSSSITLQLIKRGFAHTVMAKIIRRDKTGWMAVDTTALAFMLVLITTDAGLCKLFIYILLI